MGRFQPLRVYGPSGSRPELGTKHMIKHMREMLVWHEENFDAFPIAQGYEIDVTEFAWDADNGIVYDQDGVVVRSWPRSHGKNGAVAYRLDWEEADLSFVWTGDGRPDEKTAKYAAGADVFVTEGQADTPALQSITMGMDQKMVEYTIDGWHSLYYGAGYLFEQVQPRMAAICHYVAGGGPIVAEAMAEIRGHWGGLCKFSTSRRTRSGIGKPGCPMVQRSRRSIHGGWYHPVPNYPTRCRCQRRGSHGLISRMLRCGRWRSTLISTTHPTWNANRYRRGLKKASRSDPKRCSTPEGSMLTMRIPTRAEGTRLGSVL
jgi:hypothetical protein